MTKPASNTRAYLLRFVTALLLAGLHAPSARAGVIDPTAPARLHLASTAKTSHLLRCLANAPSVPREIARHEPHELETDLLLPCQRSVPCLVVGSPSSAPLHKVLLDVRSRVVSHPSSQGGSVRRLPTMRYELGPLLAPPTCGASAPSTLRESSLDIALTLGDGSRKLAQQSLEYADRRLAAAELNAPGTDLVTCDLASGMLRAAWEAMQEHDYAAARAFSDKAASLATVLDPE